MKAKTYSYIADPKWDGTLERRIAIILDNEIIGNVNLMENSMERLTEKIVEGVRRYYLYPPPTKK
jgi:hypothetical protein